MELEIEIFPFIVFGKIDHSGYTVLVEWSGIGCISIIVVAVGIENDHVFVQHHLNYLFASGISTIPKSLQFCAALVTLKCYDVFRKFVFVGLSVYAVSAFWFVELFATPSDESQGSFRPQSTFEDESQSFKASDETSAIVISARLRPSVPRINMPSQQQNLIRFLTPLNLKHNVIRISVIYRLTLKNQMQGYSLPSILHSLHHLSIFHCDAGRWDGRSTLLIAGMH